MPIRRPTASIGVRAMTAVPVRGWREVLAEARCRIDQGIWKPGERIPNEAELAEEFGCARSTVNRALRDLAGQGFPRAPSPRGDIRSARAGAEGRSRYPGHPIRGGGDGGRARIPASSAGASRPGDLGSTNAWSGPGGGHAARAGPCTRRTGGPFCTRTGGSGSIRCRRRSTRTSGRSAPTSGWSGNVPLVRGDIELGAVEGVPPWRRRRLETHPRAALFLVQRATWNTRGLITAVRLTYAPGYRMRATL